MAVEVKRTFDILERCLSEFPREDALGGKENDKWYTYSTREYVEKSHQFAMGMLALGLSAGDKVATVTYNRPEWNFVDMGLVMAGLVHVPVYPTIGNDEYRYILNHAEIKYLIAGDEKLYKKLKAIAKNLSQSIQIYCFDKIPRCNYYGDILDLGQSKKDKLSHKLEKIKESVLPDDLATLIYTSGTTGTPKGVMLTHKNLVSNFTTHVDIHELGCENRVVSFLPLCHVYERSVNYHFQYKGMGIYYVGNIGQIINAIREIKPHIFNTVPRLMERVYNGFLAKGEELRGVKKIIYSRAFRLTRNFEYYRKYNLLLKLQIQLADKLVYSKWREALGGNIQYIVSGGAALQPRIAKVLGMSGMPVIEGYGLTETSPVIAVNSPSSGEMRIGTVGPVLKGVEVKIAEDGEILCKGPSVMIGYYKEPGLTAEVIDDQGWFHTGDIGNFEEGKYLKITDRKKEIFKLSGGKYIAPQMIENKLKESLFIEQAMVIGENQKFASALIAPNFEYLHDWCANQKIHYRDNKELITKKEVLVLFLKEVSKINEILGQHEEVKRFRLICEEWSAQKGELSPTLKLKRNYISKKYAHIIAEIYSRAKGR